jgi:hypothetical protein
MNNTEGETGDGVHLIRTGSIQSVVLILSFSFIAGLLVALASAGTLLSAAVLILTTACSAVVIVRQQDMTGRISAGLYIWAVAILFMPAMSYISILVGNTPETLRGVQMFGNELLNHVVWMVINAILALLVAVLGHLYGHNISAGPLASVGFDT